MSRKVRKITGFTLIEILVALFIFTIVAVIMTHALRTVFNAQTTTEEHAKRLATLQMASLLLSRDLEQTIDRSIINTEGSEEAGLVGSAHTLSFTHAGLANPMGQTSRSTLQRTRYLLANRTLIRESWPVLDQTSASKSSKRELLSAASELRFEYIDKQNHINDQWPPPNQRNPTLPQAIRVSLTLSHWGTLTQLYIIPGHPLETKPI